MTACSVCLGTSTRKLFELEPYELSACADCGHVFVSSGLGPGALESAYGDAYYRSGDDASTSGYRDYLRDAPARTRGFQERLRQIEARVPTRGNLLDYGCAVGLFVKVACDAGWSAVGYERSEWATRYGRENLGVDIVLADGREPPDFEGRFDVITMWDVLEHLDRPREALQAVSRWLRPGGLLALNTINRSSLGARLAGRNWRHFAPPHHLQYFSRVSLLRLLRDCGFDATWSRTGGVVLAADRRRGDLRGILGFAESLATHWRANRIATIFNIRDEVEVMATRR